MAGTVRPWNTPLAAEDARASGTPRRAGNPRRPWLFTPEGGQRCRPRCCLAGCSMPVRVVKIGHPRVIVRHAVMSMHVAVRVLRHDLVSMVMVAAVVGVLVPA